MLTNTQNKQSTSIGDPFTEILDPDKLKALNQKVDGGFSGIGIAIQSSPDDQARGPLTVQKVFEGGPAQKGGLRAGDVITKVNGLDLNECKAN
ncbi:MAG: PDZ domain-containing protein [Candidatus Obscuribacterales bacterium]